MTIRSAKAKAQTVKTFIHGTTTEVTVFARRGSVVYGVCTTIQNAIALVELVDVHHSMGTHDLKKASYLGLYEQNQSSFANNLRVTISCFVANAYLDEAFPDLKGQLFTKITKMVSKIPQPEVYPF